MTISLQIQQIHHENSFLKANEDKHMYDALYTKNKTRLYYNEKILIYTV